MNITQALDTLGVTDSVLTEQSNAELDQKGYTLLPGLIGDEWLESLRRRLEKLWEEEGSLAGMEEGGEPGTRRLAALVDKGQEFDRIYTHPKILALVYKVIGRDFKLSILNARDALPGQGHQELHTDSSDEYDGRFHACNTIWLLDDFTEENGCTRLVPGTHRAKLPGDVLKDVMAPHPEEEHLVAPAGTVAVFNSNIWHGGTINQTKGQKRRALHCYFTARENRQYLDQREYIRNETWERISPAARYILDVEMS
jgi:ectoine hydroxylase-related dioxygenase (phytanoyl-CoA dioxygenase family)